MAYNQPQGGYSGYSDYPQHPQYGGHNNSAQPELSYSQNYAQDPFASRASFDQPSSYPPHRPYSGESQGKTGSSWSLDEPVPLVGGAGAGGAAAYSAVSRDKSNPYSKEFKSGNKPPGNRVRKWIWIIAALIVVIAIAVGIAVWRIMASKNDSNGSSSSGDGKMQYISGTSKVVKSNPSDPSQFEKDPRLKPIFYGLAYTPFAVLEPNCGATLPNVTEDLQLLSQLTTRIRTYGSACNQSELVLQAIQDTKINMTVWLGAYVGDDATVK
ncbi:hypothetical protein JCM5353_000231 [Sporobolomyces roseus]